MKAQKKNLLNQLAGEPYWFIIGLFFLISSGIFINHIATGETPSRVALHVAALNFDVFWYGILIVGGIAVGAFVTARLALAKARRILDQHVPASLQSKPLSYLNLPEEVNEKLVKHKLTHVGQVLLQWGFNPETLGLNGKQREILQQKLLALPAVDSEWAHDTPWRPWNPEYVWGGIGWCLILALIGARLYHVLTPSPSMAAFGINSPLDYFRHPLQLINVRNGGLGIYGGIAGGALGLLWYTHRHRIPTLAWADLGAVGTALGQYFGRWGNFFNQELYGRPTEMPWGISIDLSDRLAPYQDLTAYPLETTRFHPAFLYESLWNLLAFLVLLTLARRYHRKLYTGDLTALYLIFYAIGRILLELVRLDSRTVSIGSFDTGLPVATLLSIIIALVMGLWAGRRHLSGRGTA